MKALRLQVRLQKNDETENLIWQDLLEYESKLITCIRLWGDFTRCTLHLSGLKLVSQERIDGF